MIKVKYYTAKFNKCCIYEKKKIFYGQCLYKKVVKEEEIKRKQRSLEIE
jgi:hypothetical protein